MTFAFLNGSTTLLGAWSIWITNNVIRDLDLLMVCTVDLLVICLKEKAYGSSIAYFPSWEKLHTAHKSQPTWSGSLSNYRTRFNIYAMPGMDTQHNLFALSNRWIRSLSTILPRSMAWFQVHEKPQSWNDLNCHAWPVSRGSTPHWSFFALM